LDQKKLFVLLTLALVSPSYFSADTLDAFNPGTESNKSDWKTFKDRNNLFTIQYPSKWTPSYTGELLKAGPIDIFFDSLGSTEEKGPQIHFIQYDAKSAFNSANDTLESELNMYKDDPAMPGFQIKSPIECVKYTLNGIQACSSIYVYNNGKVPQGVLAVDSISSDGTEYEAYYFSDRDSFKKDSPIFEEMLTSFKTIDNNSMASNVLSGNETITDLNTTNTTKSSDDDFSLN
jgi:hypothetical protein